MLVSLGDYSHTGRRQVVIRSILAGAALCFTSAPLEAKQVAVSAAPPPAHPAPSQSPPVYPYQVYPLPGWVHPNSVRCEQDRLLTDKTPCGAETESPAPLPPCQQDRLLTDTTPCTKP